jgi:hypothetical protein
MASAAPADVPKKIACSQGVRCFNAKALHAKALEKWETAAAAGGSRAPVLKAGYQYKTSSALTGHPQGWLSCKHFCCDFLLAEARDMAILEGVEPLTCVQAHGSQCSSTGDRDRDAYQAGLEAAKALSTPRERGLVKNRQTSALQVSTVLSTVLLLWFPALASIVVSAVNA